MLSLQRIPVLLISFALTLISTASFADNRSDVRENSTLLFASDPYCPYICDKNASHPGFLVEFTRAALEPLGFQVEYELKPWKRVLAEARSGVIDGVISLSRADEDGLLLPDKPVLSTCQSVITSQSSHYQWTGADSLAGKAIALVAGYTYDGPVREWLQANKESRNIHHIHGANALEEILDLIARNKMEMTISDCNVAASTARIIGYPDTFKYFATGYQVEMYVGMYPNHPDAGLIVKTLDDTLIKMRNDGRFYQLAEKYGIQNVE